MDAKNRRISQLLENNRLLVGDEGFKRRLSNWEGSSLPSYANALSIFSDNSHLSSLKKDGRFETYDEYRNKKKKKRKRRDRSRYQKYNHCLGLNFYKHKT